MPLAIQPYDSGRPVLGTPAMPKRPTLRDNGETFGQRLARLRKKAGYSQRDLAAETGISQRMIAYYESESEHPPAHLIPALVKAFGVSADVMLGLDEPTGRVRVRDNRLWRRFSQVEKLPPGQRKRIVQLIDDLVRAATLRRAE